MSDSETFNHQFCHGVEEDGNGGHPCELQRLGR